MNAYELADDVKNISNAIEALEWVQKASPLLIQQAKEIEKLEKSLAEEEIYSGILEAMNKSTPQIKELSDEEILQQAEWMFGTYFFEMIDDQYWIEFAKAILKKASEK